MDRERERAGGGGGGVGCGEQSRQEKGRVEKTDSI